MVEDGPFVEDDLLWKTTFGEFLHAASSDLRHFFSSLRFYFFKKKINPFGPKLDHLDIYQYGITMGNNVGYA